MATITSENPSPAASRDEYSSASVKGFWPGLFARALHPYRPERHYMRGPGPACRAKCDEPAAFRLKSGDL